MSQYRIQNQIAVYKTNKKLVEFNDIRKVAIRPKEDLMQTVSSIPVSLINIAEDMKRTPPRAAKVASVLDYYQAHGELDKPIVVRKRGDRYELVDKYLRYYVAVKLGLDQIQAIVINK